MRKLFLFLLVAVLTVSTSSFAFTGSHQTKRITYSKVEYNVLKCPRGCNGPVIKDLETDVMTCGICGCKWKYIAGSIIVILTPGGA